MPQVARPAKCCVKAFDITLKMFLHFVRIAGRVLSAMLCAAAKPTLLSAFRVVASMFDVNASNSTVNLQWLQAVNGFRHLSRQGPDNANVGNNICVCNGS